MLNQRTTERYNYYYDSKLCKDKITKSILSAKWIYIFVILAIFSLFLLLQNIKNQQKTKELYDLKTFISAFVQINNLKGITEKEVDLLADVTRKASIKYQLDPALILAVISVESAFNKTAISPVGARGLMQLMPATAKGVAKELGIEYKGIKSLHDIDTNITMGTFYLHKLSKRYNMDMKLVLTAYNRGPANLEKIMKRNIDIPAEYYSKVLETYKKLTF